MSTPTEKKHNDAALSTHQEYVTVCVNGQFFGIPIDRVHDVYVATSMTHVPMSSAVIKGLINLRGRVVTAVCLRNRLGMPERTEKGEDMSVGLESGGEPYGLLVDNVGEVMRLDPDAREPNPVHMDPRWVEVSKGVHRLDKSLLVILDVEAVLAFEVETQVAA
jgi:purine-binding chemotaxis protein CheW